MEGPERLRLSLMVPLEQMEHEHAQRALELVIFSSPTSSISSAIARVDFREPAGAQKLGLTHAQE